MNFSTGNSGNLLREVVIKTGKECSIEGAFCKLLGKKVAPEILVVIPNGYVMSRLEKMPRTTDLLLRMEELLESEVWNRPSQDFDIGQLNYQEYHKNLGLEIPKWAEPTQFCLSHGDPSVSNTMSREDGSLVLIDPRPPRGYVPSCRETDAARILQSFFGWENACYGEQFVNYLLPKFWKNVDFRNRALFWLAATTVRIKHLETSRENQRNRVIRWCEETYKLCFDIINEDCLILFTDGKHQYPFFIDKEDYEEVSKYKWYRTGKYITAYIYGRLHHFLLGIPSVGYEIDHQNRNRLDNRRSNIRIVPISENRHNVDLRKDNTSGIRGVMQNSTGKWHARIQVVGISIRLGIFDTKEEAREARLLAQKKFYGETFDD